MTGFTLSDVERATYDQWELDHLAQAHGDKDPDTTAIGGRVTFEFTGTSLGVIVKVRCACGARKDLTDYEAW